MFAFNRTVLHDLSIISVLCKNNDDAKVSFPVLKETNIRRFLTRIIDYNIRHKLKKETMFEVLARCHTQFIPRINYM